jgi:AraC-like DNA-binding protein
MQLSFLSLVYFIGFSHALMMAMALWRQTEKGQSGRILAILLIVLAYKLFEGGVTYSTLYQVIPHVLNWLPGAVLLIGPLFYGYIRAVSGETKLTSKQWLLHLTPAILLIVANSPQVLILGSEKIAKITQFQSYDGPMLLPWRIVILLIILKVHLATYLGNAWCILRSFDHQIEKFRADSSPLILDRHKQLCLSLIALEFLWVVLFILHQTAGFYALDYVSKSWLLFIAIIILAMGYYGLRQPGILFSDVERALVFQSDSQQDITQAEIIESVPITGERGKYHLSSIPESTAQEVVLLIRNTLQTQQLYLDDKLTLTSLAEALELKPHMISQVINQTMQTSFYKLINLYRVEYAITLIEKQETNWSIERIAFESGFGNRVTFNNAFKSIKGCSPSVFKKNLKLAG